MQSIFAIDFDGTLAAHEYPAIGAEVPFAFDVLKRLQSKGHILILYTMRSDATLQRAVDWCAARGVEFDAVNNNPQQHIWTNSPKVYAHCYIDDAALGVPIGFLGTNCRPVVDWKAVEKILIESNYL